MSAQLSGSLSVFGDGVEVSAKAQRSQYNDAWFISFRVDRLHLAIDTSTARALHAELGRVLSEVETR